MKFNLKQKLHLIVAVVVFSLILLSSFLVIERETVYEELREAAYHSESFLPKNFHTMFHSDRGIPEVEYISFLLEVKKFALIDEIDLLYFLEYRGDTPVISMRLPKTDYEKMNLYETTYNQVVKNPLYLAKARELSRLNDLDERYKGIMTVGDKKYLGLITFNQDYAGNKYAVIVGYSLKRLLVEFFKKTALIIGIVLGALSLTLGFLSYRFDKNKKHEIISASDELTGFYTRKYLSIVEKSIKTSRTIYWGFIYVDLDGLKKINDSLGHQAGDFYILSFSDLLKQLFRHEDTIIRMGGDEFLIITSLEKPDSINVIVERLREIISNDMSFSIGWETASKKELLERGLDEVIKKADEKMYEEKRKRSNNI